MRDLEDIINDWRASKNEVENAKIDDDEYTTLLEHHELIVDEFATYASE